MKPPTDATLDQALALGGTRVATAAHPLCICGKPYTPTCLICLAKPNKPCRHQWGDPLVLSESGRAQQHRRATSYLADQRKCPMHRRRP